MQGLRGCKRIGYQAHRAYSVCAFISAQNLRVEFSTECFSAESKIQGLLCRTISITPSSTTPKPREARLTEETQPLLTYLLCVVSVIVTLAFLANPEQGTFLYRLGHMGIGSPNDIWTGRYYLLLTCNFDHGSWMHLIFNMMWLVQMGRVLESTLKPWQYALFMLGGAVVGSCSEMMLGDLGIGMSGVVYAMFGLLWAGRGAYASWVSIATRQNLNVFIGWGLLCVFLTYANIMPIANGAHGGGLLFGLCIGWLFFAPRRRPIWWIPLAALGIICVLAITWVPWSPAWKLRKYEPANDKAMQAFEAGNYPLAIQWFEEALKTVPHEATAERNIEYAWHNMALEASKRGDEKTAAEAEKQEAQAKTRADADDKSGGK